MTKVLVTFKVMPKEAGIDMDKLEKEINSSINPDKVVRVPIAFGLVALNISKLVDDAGGQVESIENKLRAMDSVGEIEVIEVTRTI